MSGRFLRFFKGSSEVAACALEVLQDISQVAALNDGLQLTKQKLFFAQ
jgi:hypothetical protein